MHRAAEKEEGNLPPNAVESSLLFRGAHCKRWINCKICKNVGDSRCEVLLRPCRQLESDYLPLNKTANYYISCRLLVQLIHVGRLTRRTFFSSIWAHSQLGTMREAQMKKLKKLTMKEQKSFGIIKYYITRA